MRPEILRAKGSSACSSGCPWNAFLASVQIHCATGLKSRARSHRFATPFRVEPRAAVGATSKGRMHTRRHHRCTAPKGCESNHGTLANSAWQHLAWPLGNLLDQRPTKAVAVRRSTSYICASTLCCDADRPLPLPNNIAQQTVSRLRPCWRLHTHTRHQAGALVFVGLRLSQRRGAR